MPVRNVFLASLLLCLIMQFCVCVCGRKWGKEEKKKLNDQTNDIQQVVRLCFLVVIVW